MNKSYSDNDRELLKDIDLRLLIIIIIKMCVLIITMFTTNHASWDIERKNLYNIYLLIGSSGRRHLDLQAYFNIRSRFSTFK